MGKIILISGGQRSGKSTFGEDLLKNKENVLYIATAKVLDSEMEERVRRHKERRCSSWETFEGFQNLEEAIRATDKGFVLLECIGTMVTNLLFNYEVDFESIDSKKLESIEENIRKEVISAVEAAVEMNKEMIVITNEVGLGLVSEYKLGRIFTDILGRVNQDLGKICTEAYFMSCGLPLKLK